ncbi:endoribonuclease E-like protein [Perilla frutescens var. hirtella]|uniref:Endoribonuclease E-like protein n=1 Tax=Perilla frutescens var. hirtella TaxID=608512 RepID=A0AAD4P4J2_PERFH|nr:endoribonuclease E-like protein [Perilla frutescens var. hirtella]
MTMASKLSLFSSTLSLSHPEICPHSSKLPVLFPFFPIFPPSQNFQISTPPAKSRRTTGVLQSSATAAGAEVEVEVAEGYTITQFVDKIIDVFLNEKPKSRDWKKYLIFRDEWGRYRERFYNRCKTRADAENDSQIKQKLIDLSRRVRKIDDEMEKHAALFKEIQESPMDINAIVAKRRGEFTDSFFRHLTLLSETYDSLDDRDAVARLGTRCLSAVSAFDNTLEIVGTLDIAQAKFDDILNSPSIDAACEKIKSLARAKELDSSLILLINGSWAAAKESATMKNEVKDIMYRIYKATQSSLRSIVPREIKLLKYLLNITDPEERFSALATAFSPGDEHVKQPDAIYTTPKELHKWIKIMLDAYHLNKEDTEIREAKKMNQPIVIQRLFILKETIEEEYLEQNAKTETNEKSEDE